MSIFMTRCVPSALAILAVTCMPVGKMRTPENPLIWVIRYRMRIGAKKILPLRTVRMKIMAILEKCLV